MAYTTKNPNGQATMANSEPVVIASDQSTVPVSVSGVSTAANQTTIIGHLDGVEGLLTTIDADTSNISTKIDTLAGAVAGTEMQVDVLTMPTVTVTATNLDVQSGGADLATSTQAGAIQTAVELIDDTVATLGTTTYTEAATKGLIIGAVRRDADTTLANTTNEITPLQVDANGYLKVEIFDGGGSHTVDNAGTFAVQVDGSALTALQLIDDTVFTDDAPFTVASSKVNAIGLLADETSTDSVDEGDIGIPRMTLDRKAIATLYPSSTSGDGCSIFRSLDIDETEEDVKTSAGNIYGYFFGNVATSVRYLKFYNATAANTTVGSTTPVLTFPLPASSSGHIAFPYPVSFSTAICVACTTGVADADTGAPAANDVIINVFYR